MDEQYMNRAIALAKIAEGFTSPNPIVGAVLVKDGEIIGEGYHAKAGEAHAEVVALRQAGESAQGATLYVTLEPCAHYGKTPPCATQIIDAGIARVVIGSRDPNPQVAGKGIQLLQEAGITVTVGVCEDTCLRMNEAFFTFIQTKRPFVTLKSAMSLDGAIATRTGDSQWITNESARQDGHRLRGSHDVILSGIGTVLADDPALTCRLTDKIYHQPDVVILDTQGRTPSDAKLWTATNRKIFIMVGSSCTQEARDRLTVAGGIVIELPEAPYGLSLPHLLDELGQRNYMSLLVEGGGAVLASFVEAGCFHKIVTYIGNILIGGTAAKHAIGGQGIAKLAEAPTLYYSDTRMIGDNIRIEAYHVERMDTHVHGNR